MPETVLAGCTPEPLMSYLKALGVFRLVVEQADPAAKLSWAGGVCQLWSKLDRNGVIDFFLNCYRPTPILAPWNGGSGFYGGGSEPLNAILNSSSGRLASYRDTITTAKQFVPATKPKEEQKEALLAHCRAELPDEVVAWLDTCFVLGEEAPSYFPLLGTGGNDGRLDFTNNFFQRLADVIPLKADVPPPSASAGWLDSALFGDDPQLTALGKAAIGQFNPGGIGGANGVQGDFEAGSRVNPWDFVLMIEGTLLLAGSVARRLGSNTAARAVFPFTVESVAVGYGSATASEETNDGSRAELWLPLWDDSAGLREVQQLFAEGRAQFGRRQARNAVEFALAACLLGVSRGIDSFTRYGFLKRNGLAFLAAPLGRVAVTPRPEARLLDDPALTDWLDNLRRACRDKDKTPARYQSALRNIDRAMYEFATGAQTGPSGKTRGLLEVLRALGRAERTLANGLRFCKEKRIRPLQQLTPQWLLGVPPAGDGGREFRLAAALASVLAEGKGSVVGSFRIHVEEVEQTGRRVTWSPGSNSAVWSNRPLPDNLAAAFFRRWMESEKAGRAGLPLRTWLFAPLADVVAFLRAETDDNLLSDFLWGLLGLDWGADWCRQTANRGAVREHFHVSGLVAPPPEFGLLRLLTRSVELLTVTARSRGSSGERELRWQVAAPGEHFGLKSKPAVEAFHLLRRGDRVGAVEAAARQLWAAGLPPFGWANRHRRQEKYITESRVDSVRLLAACLFPLSRAALTHLARQVLTPPVAETQP